MQQGRGTLLLRITGWNGTPNDAHVTASLVNAADGTTDPANTVHWDSSPAVQGLVHADSSPAAPPGWDPNQTTWYVDPLTLAPGASATLDDANQVDTQAYIREGYLVMALNNEPLSLFMGEGADIQITLADGTLMAKIAADGLHIESGVFGGRMGKNALIKASAGLIGDCGSADTITAPLLPMFADVMASGDELPGDGVRRSQRGHPVPGGSRARRAGRDRRRALLPGRGLPDPGHELPLAGRRRDWARPGSRAVRPEQPRSRSRRLHELPHRRPGELLQPRDLGLIARRARLA